MFRTPSPYLKRTSATRNQRNPRATAPLVTLFHVALSEMQMFTVLRLALAATLIGRAAAACAADNCYNQLSRHTADASSFCAGFTSTTVTDNGLLPTYVSTSCGTGRVSSACSCLWPAAATTATTTSAPPAASCPSASTVTTVSTATITVTSTPSPTNLVVNGAITGLAPWFNGDIINESSYNYNPPQIALVPGSPTGGAM